MIGLVQDHARGEVVRIDLRAGEGQFGLDAFAPGAPLRVESTLVSYPRGLSREQAALRIAAQRPADEKLRRADAVITNDASLEDLLRQIEAAWNDTVRPALNT